VEHCLETNLIIDFGEATILTRSTGYMDRVVKEAIEIRLHANNFNRDIRFMLSQAWGPLINLLNKAKKLEQHSDRMDPERTEAGLSNTNREQQQEENHQHEGPG
jgi:hypothetical protein